MGGTGLELSDPQLVDRVRGMAVCGRVPGALHRLSDGRLSDALEAMQRAKAEVVAAVASLRAQPSNGRHPEPPPSLTETD
jgi:hypothetical protein